MPESGGEVTLLLTQLREGHPEASHQLAPLVYAELRRMAAAYMRHERPGHTLQATGLVHEAYMRLVGSEQPAQAQNRSHFYAIAANTMRRVLLDYARQRDAGKRGGGARKVDLDQELSIGGDSLEDVIAVDEVLSRLSEIDPQQARIVEIRFFAGLSVEETAEALGISPTTVKREWRLAKAWFHQQLAGAKSE